MKNTFKSDYIYLVTDKSGVEKLIVADFNFTEIIFSFHFYLDKNEIKSSVVPACDYKGNDFERNMKPTVLKAYKEAFENTGNTVTDEQMETFEKIMKQLSYQKFKEKLIQYGFLQGFLKRVFDYHELSLTTHIEDILK